MESFEQVVAVAMEAEGLVVSPAVKFPVKRATNKAAYKEEQTHGYEVDLVGASAPRLVLATVKSFFGSRGVVADHVCGTGGAKSARNGYKLLNDSVIRDGVIAGACERYGYAPEQVELRLYVGRFAGKSTGAHERTIRAWAATQQVGAGPVRVYGLAEIMDDLRTAASSKTYRDNPVLVTMKMLAEAGLLTSEAKNLAVID